MIGSSSFSIAIFISLRSQTGLWELTGHSFIFLPLVVVKSLWPKDARRLSPSLLSLSLVHSSFFSPRAAVARRCWPEEIHHKHWHPLRPSRVWWIWLLFFFFFFFFFFFSPLSRLCSLQQQQQPQHPHSLHMWYRIDRINEPLSLSFPFLRSFVRRRLRRPFFSFMFFPPVLHPSTRHICVLTWPQDSTAWETHQQ